jgi:hypothetical protein
MGNPKHESEVIRAKVSEIVTELRARLRDLGLSADEIAIMTREAERDAARYLQTA